MRPPLSCCRRANVGEQSDGPPALARISTDAVPLEFRVVPTGDETLDQIMRKRRVAALEHMAEMKGRYQLEQMTPAQRHFLSDATFLRYLEARDGDVGKASEMLDQTLKWRADRLDGRPNVCPACARDPSAHCFIPLGEDSRGWQLIYSCAARASDKHSDSSVTHMAATLERLFDGSAKPGKIVWIIDMHGFGWRDLDTSMATSVVPMFSNHYPERMGQFVILDPPAALKVIWDGLVALLDPVTRRKIKLLRAEKLDYFREHCRTPAQLAFLEAVLQAKAVPSNLPQKETQSVVAEAGFPGVVTAEATAVRV